MSEPLQRMLNENVVLDTGTAIIYIGRLVELSDHVFVLEQADMHDCRDGHLDKEAYLAEAAQGGLAVNRRQVVVMRSAVISVSRLTDITAES